MTRCANGEVTEPVMQFFAWEHLPKKLQAVSRPFGTLAELIVGALPLEIRNALLPYGSSLRARMQRCALHLPSD